MQSTLQADKASEPQSPQPGFKSAAKKRKYDSRSVARYVTNLQYSSKEMYDVFREQAIESGLFKQTAEPLPRLHRNYYDKYIRGTHGTPLPSDRTGERSSTGLSVQAKTGRTRSRLRSSMSKAADYIPLRDLLRHNHDERVQGYLKVLN